ncbi:hypothetical protein [Streptomyces sp. NPDC000880]
MSGAKDIVRSDNIGVAADLLRRYEEVGVSHVIFSLESSNLDRLRETTEDIASRVRPAVE